MRLSAVLAVRSRQDGALDRPRQGTEDRLTSQFHQIVLERILHTQRKPVWFTPAIQFRKCAIASILLGIRTSKLPSLASL